jgi:hypothetical protein
MAQTRRRVDDYRDAVSRSDLPSSAKLVAQAISRYMNYRTLGGAYPGPARIAKEVGMSTRTVKRWLATLTRLGWLEKTSIGGSYPKRHATVYRGRFPKTTSDNRDTSQSTLTSDSHDTGQDTSTSDRADTITSDSADVPTGPKGPTRTGRRSAPVPHGPARAPRQSYVVNIAEVEAE